jgi:hypothetical protein
MQAVCCWAHQDEDWVDGKARVVWRMSRNEIVERTDDVGWIKKDQRDDRRTAGISPTLFVCSAKRTPTIVHLSL